MVKSKKIPEARNFCIRTTILIAFVIFLATALSGNSRDMIKKGSEQYLPLKNTNKHQIKPPDYSKLNYAAPEWEWIQEPYSIMTSWYDYMPSSYEGYPLRLQHNGDGGMYFTWHAIDDDLPSTNRRQYSALINAVDGSLLEWGKVTQGIDIWQGFGSVVVHPQGGNGIFSWHQSGYDEYGTWITFDPYNFTPPSPPSPALIGSGEYIWPYLWIGPAPHPDSLRVYQTAKNYGDNPGGGYCEDVRILYCDIENSDDPDLYVLLDSTNWTQKTPMANWCQYECRVQSQCFTVDPYNPGHVAIIGFVSYFLDNSDNIPTNPGVFVWESFDYGETWDESNLHSSPNPDYAFYYVDNIPQFGNPPIPAQLSVSAGGWHNSARYDSEGNLHWCYLQQYGYTDLSDNSYYFPNYMPAAECIWDGDTFSFNEVPELPGTDPLSGHSVPWEIDPDTGDTLTYPVVAWSTYEDELFHENTMKNAVNKENGWIVQLWADGTYITLNNLGEPGYSDYATHPILYLSASADNGANWSEPIKITDIKDSLNNPTQFSDQITVYPYLCDEITDLGNGWGQIHISYLDDNSFGSFIQGGGSNDGGQIMYGSLKINFDSLYLHVDQEAEEFAVNGFNAYPNPITSSTDKVSIKFSLSKPGNVKIQIFNIKGQLVSTVLDQDSNSGEHIITHSLKEISTGIYFIKLEVHEKTTAVKKMVRIN